MKRFVFSLRENIVSLVNRAINVAGRKKAFRASVTLIGLRTRQDVDAAIDKLLNGQITVEEIAKTFVSAD
jgi:hypothetical protein